MAIAISPRCVTALEGRAIVHYTMGNYFGAFVDICKAVEVDPKNAEFLVNRAVIYQALNDIVPAMKDYKVIALNE
jgi:Flp pilus assembly protein TadD